MSRKPRKIRKAKQLPFSNAMRAALANSCNGPKAMERERHLRALMGLPSRTFSDGTSIRDEP